jgi:hypothetical protein
MRGLFDQPTQKYGVSSTKSTLASTYLIAEGTSCPMYGTEWMEGPVHQAQQIYHSLKMTKTAATIMLKPTT